MKNLIKDFRNKGRAATIICCIPLLWVLTSCHPTTERTVHQSFTDSVKINQTCEVEAPSEPRIAMRAANIPDFWDTTYKANKLIRLYIEADTLFRALYKDTAEQAIRARVALMNRVCEPMYGIRFEIVQLVIRTRSDQTYRATAATPMLYAWTTEYPTLPADLFKLRISGKNIGGSAYLSRGSVTSAKWAVVGMGFVPMGNERQPGNLEYNMLHELCHNMGLSHAFNCCVWLDRNGKQLGRLDSTWAGERTCSPSPTCRNTSKRHPSGPMGYGHFWQTPIWNLHPAIRKVWMESLFYSTVPSYTPTQQQPIQPTWTFLGTTLSGTTANVNDGNTDTRWVTTGRSSVTITYPDSVSIQSIRVLSGFLSNNRWGSPIQPLRVLVNGSQVFSATTSKPDTTIRIFRKVRSVTVEGNDPANNRWREILIQ